MQCFHWPNITTCGKYPCACGMPERYFVFTCCSANASISASTKKGKILIFVSLCLCLRQGHFHGEIRIIVFTLVLGLVLASLVKTKLMSGQMSVLV